MTAEAKKILKDLFQKYDPEYDYSGHEITERDMNVISDFTLSIIEKAVGAEVNRKDTAYLYKTVSEEVGRNILSRVKQELGVE